MNARELNMTPAQLAAEQDRQRAAAKARRSRVRPKRAGSVAKKKTTAKERRERVAAIRIQVWARADQHKIGEWGACEFCRTFTADDLHHVLSGGMRRRFERADTCAAACYRCHRAYHDNDMGTLRAAKEWALRNGFRDALHAIEKRIAKVEEAHPEHRKETP